MFAKLNNIKFNAKPTDLYKGKINLKGVLHPWTLFLKTAYFLKK